ncbi:MAG: signal peptidase II [Deltaproteobacteria bacterium]|nr:signal peptidase II [Deltaproteobacteria bacterium]
MIGGFVNRRWILMSVVVAIGVAVDQCAKRLAHAWLRDRGVVPLIDGYFDLRYSRNPGIFFGLGSEFADVLRMVVLIGGSLLAIGLILEIFRKASDTSRFLRWALMLLLAGACGNLIDRIREGEVIDFFHLHWQEVFHWATFNVADVLIVIGLVLLIIDVFQKRQSSPRSSSFFKAGE